MRLTFLATAASLSACLAAAGPALAADVLVLRPTGDDRFIDELYHRVGGELRVHAFTVRPQDATGEDVSLTVAQELLGATGAAACVSFIAQGETSVVRVWVAGPDGAPNLFEAVSLRRAPDAPTVLAARAVDLLAIAVERIRPSPPAAASPTEAPAVTAEAETVAAAPPPTWMVGAGVIALNAGTTFGWASGPAVTVTHAVTPRWSVGVRAALALDGQRLTSPDGQATIGQDLLLGEVHVALFRWRALAGLLYAGLGADHLRVTGDTAPDVASATPSRAAAWAPALAAGALVTLAIGPHVGLDAGGGLTLTWPRPRIHLGHETVGFSQPQAALTVGAHVMF